MSAYGDIVCPLCDVRHYELDPHHCTDENIALRVAALKERAERAEAENADWVARYDGLHDVLSAAGRQLAAAQSTIAELRAALAGLLKRYVDLAGSGDCGNWDPETEDQVIAARAALKGEQWTQK